MDTFVIFISSGDDEQAPATNNNKVIRPVNLTKHHKAANHHNDLAPALWSAHSGKEINSGVVTRSLPVQLYPLRWEM